MSRRIESKLLGKKYCGNSHKKEVHDLDIETVQCQIEEIIHSDHVKTFDPDTLSQAHKEEYDNCAYCIGKSKR